MLALTGMIVLGATAVGLSQGSQAANESLWEAAREGDSARVTAALSQGADVNAQDSFYRERAADMAGANGHSDVVIYLLQNGAEGDGILVAGVEADQEALVKAAVAGKVTRQGLQAAINLAGVLKRDALVTVIKA
jgi:ankyrin repeat protein